VLLSVLQHIHSRLAPRAPFRLLGYSFGGLLALELALQLEAEGREGKLYLVDSAPDFLKALLTQSMGSNEDEFQTSLICGMFILIAPHEATSAAVSKVYHERNVTSYEYWNALSDCVWLCKFVTSTHSWTVSIQIPNSAAGHVIIMLCLILFKLKIACEKHAIKYKSIYKCPKF